MRSDMGKIVIDAYRFGGWRGREKNQTDKWHRKTPQRLLEAPNKVSNSRGKGGSTYPGDTLSPLYRWLDKQVGRKWDDVYSEICNDLRGTWSGVDHVIGHVLQRVERDEIRWIDGWPHSRARYYRANEWSALRRDNYFVDENGFLRRPPQKRMSPDEKRRREHERRQDILMLDDMTAAAKIDGVWFMAELHPIPKEWVKVIDHNLWSPYRNKGQEPIYTLVERDKQVFDVLVEMIRREKRNGRWVVDRDRYVRVPYERQKLYAPSVKTMSKKEIKQRIPENMR